MKRRALISWSGGKDSALALHALRRDRGVELAGLLTTVTEDYQRISMHGIRRALLDEQALSVGLPPHVVLNHVFGTRFELLPDRNYFPPTKPYQLRDVTAVVGEGRANLSKQEDSR